MFGHILQRETIPVIENLLQMVINFFAHEQIKNTKNLI